MHEENERYTLCKIKKNNISLATRVKTFLYQMLHRMKKNSYRFSSVGVGNVKNGIYFKAELAPSQTRKKN